MMGRRPFGFRRDGGRGGFGGAVRGVRGRQRGGIGRGPGPEDRFGLCRRGRRDAAGQVRVGGGRHLGRRGEPAIDPVGGGVEAGRLALGRGQGPAGGVGQLAPEIGHHLLGADQRGMPVSQGGAVAGGLALQIGIVRPAASRARRWDRRRGSDRSDGRVSGRV